MHTSARLLPPRAHLKTVWSALAMILIVALAWGGATVPAASAATTGTISGTVLTDTGEPYPGYDPETRNIDRVQLFQRVADDDGIWAWQRKSINDGLLDTQGRYTFSGLPAGDYTLMFGAEQEEFAFQYAGGVTAMADPGLTVVHVDGDEHTVDARLAKGGGFSGTVRSGVEGVSEFDALISVYIPRPTADGTTKWEQLRTYRKTSESGPGSRTFALNGLPEGTYKLIFTASGKIDGETRIFQGQWYKNKPDVETANFVAVTGRGITELDPVTLVPTAKIRGKLTLKDTGEPVPAQASVTVYRRTSTPVGDTWRNISGETVVNGEFRVSNVPPGIYTFRFGTTGLPSTHLQAYYGGPGKNAYSLDDAVGIEVADTGELVDLEAALDPAPKITGTVTAANGGTPMAEVDAVLYGYQQWDGDDAPSWQEVSRTATSASGAYEFLAPQLGQYRVGFEPAAATGYRPQYYTGTASGTDSFSEAKSIDLSQPATEATANAVLAKGGTISGQVSNTAGSAPANAVPVYLLRLDGSQVAETTTNIAGSFAFPAVKDGSYKIKYNREGINSWVSSYYKAGTSNGVGVDTLAEATPLVISNASKAEFIDTKLKTGLTISGSAGVGNANVKVQLYALADGKWNELGTPTVTNASGAYTSNGLRKGTYRVGFSDGASPVRFSDLYYPAAIAVENATDVSVDTTSVVGISVEMKQGATIGGVATPKTGLPLATLRVDLYRASGSGASTSYRVVKTATVDTKTGAYTFSGVVPGTYRVGFTDTQYRWYAPTFYSDGAPRGVPTLSAASDVTVESGGAKTDASVALSSGAILGGTITHNSSTSKIVVDVFRRGGALGMNADWAVVQTQTFLPVSGSIFRNFTINGLASGDYKIRYSDANGRVGTKFFGGGPSLNDESTRTLTLVADGVKNYRKANITLSPAAKVSGTVTGPAGAPAAGITVNAYRKDGSDWALSPVQTKTSETGAYTLGGLVDGLYRLKFTDPSKALATEYYNNSGTLEDGDDILVGEGETRSGIDARMDTSPPAAKTATVSALQFFPTTAQQGSAPSALVQVAPSAGSKTPTGTVFLVLDGKVVGAAKLDASGAAALTAPTTLPQGRHTFTAMYGGDDLYRSSVSAPVILPVVPAAPGTYTTLALSKSVLHAGEKANATVWVDTLGGAKAAGTVELQMTSPRQEVLATGTLAGGTVELPIPALTADEYTLKAVFKPSGAHSESSSDEKKLEVSGKAVSTTELELEDSSIIIGQKAKAKVTVQSESSFSVAGSVSIATADGVVLATGSIAEGETSTTLELADLGIGTYPLTATFNGNNGLAASTSKPKSIEVILAARPANVSFDLATTRYGEQLEVPVTITRADGEVQERIRGSVQFFDNDTGTLIGTASSVKNGGATLELNTAGLGGVGEHSLSVKYTGGGVMAPATSTARTITVAPGVLEAPVPELIGDARVGSTVSADAGMWPVGAKLSYQWRLNGNPIEGATEAGYAIPASAAGGKLSVAVTGTVENYEPLTKISAERTVASGAFEAPTPEIEGRVAVGSTVSVKTGTWPEGAKLSYQWRLNGNPIEGATEESYAILASDSGGKLSIAVTGKVEGYEPVTAVSAERTVASGELEAPTPEIEGRAAVGSTVSVKTGTWPEGAKLSYQWRLNGNPIAGATAATHTIGETAVGGKLSVAVTGELDGYDPVTKTSAEQTVADGGKLVMTKAPLLGGSAKVGATLTASTGAWNPAATSYLYQWTRNGATIPGATKAGYKLTTADAGKKIAVTITARRAGFVDTPVTSAAKAIALAVKKKPKVSGVAQVGAKLKAKKGSWWGSPTKYSYQWYRGKKKIRGATKSSYVVKTTDAGKKLRVKVTAKRSGFPSAVVYSGYTKPASQ